MNNARGRPECMTMKWPLLLVQSVLGSAIAAGAWWLVYSLDVEAILRHQERAPAAIIAMCMLFGGLGGMWLGIDRPHPFRWAYCGAVLAGSNPMAILWFSPDLDFGWPMIVFPAASAFAAVVGARIASARPCEAHPARRSARIALIPIALGLGFLVWPVQQASVPNLQSLVLFLFGGVLVVQEVRILRLERRVSRPAEVKSDAGAA